MREFNQYVRFGIISRYEISFKILEIWTKILYVQAKIFDIPTETIEFFNEF